MAFSQKKIYLVIALTVISLVGVVLVQFFWIDAAFETQRKQFEHRSSSLLNQFGESVQADKPLHNALLHLVAPSCATGEPDPTYTVAAIRDSLEMKIDSVFQSGNFNITYNFAVVRHNEGSIVNRHEVLLSSLGAGEANKFKNDEYQDACACSSLFGGNGHIYFDFPNKDLFIAKQIWEMLALSILFVLAISGCFAYTIITIRRQKKLSEMKNDFINNLTHEFKTPIFSISLASKALGNSEKVTESKKLSKYLDLIDGENKRLKTQVDKVLQMAMLDSDNFHLEKKNINLHDLIRRVTQSFELIVENQNGSINLDLNARKDLLYADETHLSNIIYNLVDNAVKYSEDEPEITITTTDTKDGVCFSVKDNGIGMDTDEQKYIFDKFYRAQSGDIYKDKGFGLGLSYVKSIVDAHKGWIKLKSALNKGSEFTVYIPKAS